MPSPVHFKNSLLLSISLHAGLFVLAAVMVALLRSGSEPGMDIDSIDFAFIPAQEEREHMSRLDTGEPEPRQGATESALPASPAPAPENADDRTNPTLPDESTQPPATATAGIEGKNEALASDTPNYMPVETDRAEVHSIPEYHPVPLRGGAALQDIDQQMSLQEATLQIPENEQNKLLQRVQKITENYEQNHQRDMTVTWRNKGREYIFALRHKPSDSGEGFDELVVKITKKEQGTNLTTEMRLQRLAFSHFAKFINYWDPNVAVHDDEFEGRFHSNTPFRISNSRGTRPRFRGKVTAPDYRFATSGLWSFMQEDSIFLEGIETGVKAIRMPDKIAITAPEERQPDSTFCFFDDETWITFHSDGTFSQRSRSENKSRQRRIPQQGVLLLYGEKSAPLHVRGVVCGKVMVYSKNKIIIEDDLIYKRHPELYHDADDYLGLVSEKDVEIAPPKVTGPGDLRIHAAIFARRQFKVRQFYKKNSGRLYVYGSLTAGMISATEPRYGTRIRFDKRLQQRRPAHFPLTNRFELSDWQRRWRVQPRE